MASTAIEVPRVSKQRNALFFLYLGFLLTGVVNAILGPLLPVLQSRFQVTDSELGTLFAAQFAGASLGGLVSQWRLRLSIIGGYALIAAGLLGLSISAWAAVPIAVFAFGFGLGAAIPATNMTVAHAQRERRAASLNVLNLIWGAGAASSAVVVALVLRWLQFSGMLVFIAACSAAICAALMLVRIPLFAPGQTERQPGRAAGRLLSYCMALFLYIGVEGCVGGWAGTYAATMAHGSLYTTLSLVAFWGALLGGRAIAAMILRYISDDALFKISLLMTAAGLLVFVIARSGTVVVFAALIAGLGLAPIFALLLTLMSRYAEAAGTAIPGWLFSLGSMGGAALPWLFGVTSTHFGGVRYGLVVPCIGTVILALFAFREGKLNSAQ